MSNGKNAFFKRTCSIWLVDSHSRLIKNHWSFVEQRPYQILLTFSCRRKSYPVLCEYWLMFRPVIIRLTHFLLFFLAFKSTLVCDWLFLYTKRIINLALVIKIHETLFCGWKQNSRKPKHGAVSSQIIIILGNLIFSRVPWIMTMFKAIIRRFCRLNMTNIYFNK